MSALLAQPVTEHFEVWVPDLGDWRFKALFRDFNVAWVVAGARAGPVRIVRAMYENGKQAERKVVAELRVAHQHAEDRTEGIEAGREREGPALAQDRARRLNPL